MANANLPRLHDLFPKLFSGDSGCDPHAHWLKWMDYCQKHNLNDQQKMAEFQMTLDFGARTWIAEKRFNAVNALRDAFISYFSGYSSREATLEAFRSCQWDGVESVDVYAGRLRRLGAQLNMNADLLKDQFLQGLPFECKQSVVMSGVNNLDDYVHLAQRYADLQKHRKPLAIPQVSFSMQNDLVNNKIDGLIDCVQQLAVVMKNDRHRDHYDQQDRGRNRNRYRSDSRNRHSISRDRKNRSLSREKNKPRHKSPYPSRDSSRSKSGDRTCNFCNKKGHEWRQCFRLEDSIKAGKVKDF